MPDATPGAIDALAPLPFSGHERIDQIVEHWARERGTQEALSLGE